MTRKRELDSPGIPEPGPKRNQLRLEVGVVFQKWRLAAEARLPDKPVFARQTLGARMIEDPCLLFCASTYAVVIVTLNVLRAPRVTGHTAFVHFGELVEFSKTEQISRNPTERANEDLRHWPLRPRNEHVGQTSFQ
jgi:hypothetical protein